MSELIRHFFGWQKLCVYLYFNAYLNFVPYCWPIHASINPSTKVHNPRTTARALRPTPFKKVQSWERNALSNPGPWSTVHGPWLLAKLLAKIGRLTYSLILLRYWLDWKSGQKWSLNRASNSAPGHHFPSFKVLGPWFKSLSIAQARSNRSASVK